MAFVQLLNQTGTTQLHINIDINALRQTKHKTEPAGKGITPVRWAARVANVRPHIHKATEDDPD